MDPDEYRRTALANWEAMAPGWERRREFIERTSGPVAEWLLEAIVPKPGQTILELAAGPGETGFVAAALLGDEGRLISTDFSPAMVDIARRRSEELGLPNVEHRVMDAERIELEDDSVDGVLCRFGYMLMPDPAAAMAETRRVLRDGGRLALAVWRGPDANPWIAVSGRVLAARGLVPPPDPDAPSIFGLADEEKLRGLLEGAGFIVERMEDVPVRFTYGGVEDYVERAKDTGGIFKTVWNEASEDERAALQADLEEAFAPFAVGAGYEFEGLALCALAD